MGTDSRKYEPASGSKIHVTQRRVRERFEGLKAKKIKNEERASGISQEHTELDSLMEEIIENESVAESSREST